MDELEALRIEIAKVKGYTFWDSLDKLGLFPRKGNPASASYAGGIPLYKVENPDPDRRVWWDDDDPDWTHDIAAGWDLIKETEEEGYLWDVFQLHKNGRAASWRVEIHRADDIGALDLVVARHGETAPEAISRAYLALKEMDKR